MAKKSSSDDLLNEIMARRKANQVAQQTDPLARVLDALNAMDALDSLRRRAYLCYGPKVIRSAAPSMAVVIWQRPPGYYGYKTLKLAGVWVYLRGTRTAVCVGQKLLAFSAPFYDADAYHKLIRKSYDLYYKDDNRPPSKPAYSVAYDGDVRLDLRGIVAHEVAKLVLNAGERSAEYAGEDEDAENEDAEE
jgi:hypothetical protein